MKQPIQSKSITFDKEAQEALPQHVKDKMRANRRVAEIERKNEKALGVLLALTLRHKTLREEENIIISIYTNASGFLWSACKVDSGTDLGWSDHNGDCEMSGSFTTYEKTLEDALDLIANCNLKKFKNDVPAKRFHWGNYIGFLDKKYRGG